MREPDSNKSQAKDEVGSKSKTEEPGTEEAKTGELGTGAAPAPDKAAAAARKRWIEALVLVVLVAVGAAIYAIQIPKAAVYIQAGRQIQEGRGSMEGVWDSLGLTQDQIAKRDALLKQFSDGPRNPEFRAAFEKLLTPEQAQKMRESRQRRGEGSGGSERGKMARQIIEDLKLTAEQEQKRAALADRLAEGTRNPDFWPELEKILTDEQKATLHEGLKKLEAARREGSGPSSSPSQPAPEAGSPQGK